MTEEKREVRDWRRFGASTWILGIAFIVIGSPLSQLRETRPVVAQVCDGYCRSLHIADVEVITPVAWIGYLLVLLAAGMIISGFAVYFVLSSTPAKTAKRRGS